MTKLRIVFWGFGPNWKKERVVVRIFRDVKPLKINGLGQISRGWKQKPLARHGGCLGAGQDPGLADMRGGQDVHPEIAWCIQGIACPAAACSRARLLLPAETPGYQECSSSSSSPGLGSRSSSPPEVKVLTPRCAAVLPQSPCSPPRPLRPQQTPATCLLSHRKAFRSCLWKSSAVAAFALVSAEKEELPVCWSVLQDFSFPEGFLIEVVFDI